MRGSGVDIGAENNGLAFGNFNGAVFIQVYIYLKSEHQDSGRCPNAPSFRCVKVRAFVREMTRCIVKGESRT